MTRWRTSHWSRLQTNPPCEQVTSTARTLSKKRLRGRLVGRAHSLVSRTKHLASQHWQLLTKDMLCLTLTHTPLPLFYLCACCWQLPCKRLGGAVFVDAGSSLDILHSVGFIGAWVSAVVFVFWLCMRSGSLSPVAAIRIQVIFYVCSYSWLARKPSRANFSSAWGCTPTRQAVSVRLHIPWYTICLR